ncbi:MAG: DUF4437 domain-containing protein [Gammaproteobacteria bacterium]|nr:DUF4437 domain-containing protein [Gammaproteobacteria bacterium]MCP4090111.1 DUF4437 domain-containing protein [Gammaproteobacteria bacterium]MCP4276999.1 DUF4437 domain-containing protein [Gammaproteobacteria bacterium]MCP4832778.1 DUF4437 domain-containing protein [Gammaproteobacteria bacterium]MCP4929971.1 DUF4437 domain-containing protein [Gammaproteobacteria bacterium]
MARKHIEPFVDREVPFKKMTLPGFKKGMHYKMLSIDEDTGACTMTVKYDAGYKLPPGMSYTEYELIILSGTIKYGDDICTAGYYVRVPAGVHMPAMHVPRGAMVMLMYNFAEPSFVESDEDHELAMRSQLTLVDSYEGMQWMPSSGAIYPAVAPGCLLKILKYDPLTEALSFLYCMTPKFWQDNISYHDCAEEAYHIWGTSWMMQFGDLPTGGYFWRPPWINHGAFRSDYGILAFGRTDSKLHNYFHWNPWTSPLENRDRAAAQLARTKPDLFNWAISKDGHNHPHDFEVPDWKEGSEYV